LAPFAGCLQAGAAVKALISRAPGPPEALVIEEVGEPAPGPGEVRIAVAACAVNFPDALIIEDRYQVRPQRPFSPGAEVAGVIDAVGPGVGSLRAGDRVIGFSNWGGMAEKLVLPADRCVPMPAGMPFDEAAALLMTYGTALYGLKVRGSLSDGEAVLVLGAGGGVGLAAVEVGRALGARVIAAVSSEAKAEAACAAGAERAIVYPRGPFDNEGRKALSALFKGVCPDGADVVFDPVGGDYAEAALRSIRREGRFLVVGFPAGIPRLPLNLVLLKSCQVVGVAWGAVVRDDAAAFQGIASELIGLYEQGRIRPRISERFPLERAAEAIARLGAREAVGKLLVSIARA
jgi:NADPH2:quinone reductase